MRSRGCSPPYSYSPPLTSAPVALTGAPVDGVVPISEMEKQSIFNALAQTNGDKLLAARLLGIGKTTLYRKLKEYGAQA